MMYPFRNILFPTDFTQHTRAAVKYAAALARDGNGRVVMLNVQDARVPPNLLTLPDRDLEEQENSWLLQLKSDAKDLLADRLFDGVEVDTVFVDGDPAREIGKGARNYESDLITVVTRGRKGLSRAWAGSIAEEIIADSPCPVLAIRPPQHDFIEHRDGKTHIHLNRILLATNFRPSSAAATHLATQIANRTGAELHALYVIGDYFEQISAMFPEGGLAALTRLRSYIGDRMSHLARGEGRKLTTHIAEGRPYEEIVRRATQTDADIIVIGTAVHSSLFGGSAVLGSEVERVIRNAPCPVLCVPAARVVTPLPALVTQPAST